ncbi:MAG: hypothetical protein E7311_06445 [Clostridiales bacterium]|nr:hypothetical protein [Clostridiales bacterium]
MRPLTLKDFKALRELACSKDINDRLKAAQCEFAPKKVLSFLSEDTEWIVRLSVSMNSNITENLLNTMKKREKEVIVLNQINAELEHIRSMKALNR